MGQRTTARILFGFLVIGASVLGVFAQQPGGGRGAGFRRAEPPPLFFRETWKDTAMTPMSQDGVANPDLLVALYGPGNPDDFGVTNEGNVPHIWTGLCNSACAVTLRNKNDFVDLTGRARIKWYVKTSGFHEIRPVLKLADGTYLVGDHVDTSPFDWRESEFYLSEVRWLTADMPNVLTRGRLLDQVDLSQVDEIGFADLTPGSGHGDGGYSDVGWIEVYGRPVPRDGR
jgi:hypothetical protein